MARNRCGTIRQIPHREGWWCVFRKGIGRKPNGARKYQFFTRFGNRFRHGSAARFDLGHGNFD